MYRIEFEEKADKDLESMPSKPRGMVLRAIHKRLAVAPLLLGKQLQHDLSWCRVLGVGHWRVGYTVEGETVYIERIEMRRDAYTNW